MQNSLNHNITLNRLTQLDGLRGLAILGVLVNHFGQFQGALQCGWNGEHYYFISLCFVWVFKKHISKFEKVISQFGDFTKDLELKALLLRNSIIN